MQSKNTNTEENAYRRRDEAVHRGDKFTQPQYDEAVY